MALSFTIAGVEELVGILGNLRAGVAAIEQSQATVGTSLPYAHYVEFGTAPHVIAARTARALSWPGAAHPVRRVNHPGTKPNPFLENALAGNEAAVADLVAGAVTTLATGGPVSAVRVALLAAGDLVAGAAKAAAPVRTGALRDSIVTRYTGQP